MRHRHELTDTRWQRIEPWLPGKISDPGRTATDNRLFVNAVLYVLKTGIPWPDLPERFGKPNTVWKRYDHWCTAGVWKRIGQALGHTDLTGPHIEVQLDSTSVKAPPTASTGRRLRHEKTERQCTSLPRSIAWGIDHQATCGGEWGRPIAASDSHARSMWRCTASRDVA